MGKHSPEKEHEKERDAAYCTGARDGWLEDTLLYFFFRGRKWEKKEKLTSVRGRGSSRVGGHVSFSKLSHGALYLSISLI